MVEYVKKILYNVIYVTYVQERINKMPQPQKKYTIANTRSHLTDILNQASYGKERIEILRRNKPIAYIVPVEDVEILEKLEDMQDISDAESRKNEPTVSLDEIRKELGL